MPPAMVDGHCVQISANQDRLSALRAGNLGDGLSSVVRVCALLAASWHTAAACLDDVPMHFVDVPASASGLDWAHRSGGVGTAKRWMIECVGPGLGLIDVDGDGDLDVYFVQGGTVDEDGRPIDGSDVAGDALYLNDGAGRFARATKGDVGKGFGFGVTAADVDGDDDVDLFIANLGFNELLLNDGKGVFTRAPNGNGLAGAAEHWSMAAAFADVDGDGDLDAYVANYLAHDLEHERIGGGQLCRWVGCEVPCGPAGLEAQADRFYLNDGDGHFTDMTDELGFADAERAYAFQPVFSDFDGDGDPDLFVANDSVPNALWTNTTKPGGAPTFEEQGLLAGVALSDTGKEQAAMGVAVADIDDDGRDDLVMTNFSQEANALFKNESDSDMGMLFFDEGQRSGIGRPSFFDLGWGTNLFDADLDGDRDLFVANGHVYPHVDGCEITKTSFAQRNRMFEQVARGRFRPIDEAAGPGFVVEASSRGSVAGDIDGDGDVDVLVVNLDGPPTLLRNDGRASGAWSVVGLRPLAIAVGARVELTVGDATRSAEVRCGSSFLCAEPSALHFGLGELHADDTLSARVRWRDGLVEVFDDLEPGKVLTLVRGEGEAQP